MDEEEREFKKQEALKRISTKIRGLVPEESLKAWELVETLIEGQSRNSDVWTSQEEVRKSLQQMKEGRSDVL
jgi:uncharacterized protein (DUF2384 family)